VPVLVAKRDAHARERVLRLAGALGGLGGPADEAPQRHIERLLLDPGRLGGKAQLLQRLDPDPDLVRGLADGVRRRDPAVHKSGQPADRGHTGERAAQRADAGPQQLRLAAEPLEPARGAIARGLDALQALLAALANRDRLSLDLAAALDRQTDRIGLGASGHDLGFLDRWRASGRLGGTLPRPVSGSLTTSCQRGPMARARPGAVIPGSVGASAFRPERPWSLSGAERICDPATAFSNRFRAAMD
jgi:hypothetical protein